jgi:hypothetical protein
LKNSLLVIHFFFGCFAPEKETGSCLGAVGGEKKKFHFFFSPPTDWGYFGEKFSIFLQNTTPSSHKIKKCIYGLAGRRYTFLLRDRDG